jgi:uncharacterized protein YjbI with pentapeptide repeats
MLLERLEQYQVMDIISNGGNFSNRIIENIDFPNSFSRKLDFTGCLFISTANFSGTIFDGSVDFKGTLLKEVSIWREVSSKKRQTSHFAGLQT